MEEMTNVENFAPKPEPVESLEQPNVVIERGTPVHKLNRRQRGLMEQLSLEALGCTSRWTKLTRQPKPVGYEIDKKKTIDPNKPVFRTTYDLYTADEIVVYLEKLIIIRNLPDKEVTQLSELSQQASGHAKYRDMWKNEFIRDPRPADKAADILIDIIAGLKSMMEYREFSMMEDKKQISHIAKAFNAKKTLSLPLSFLIVEEKRKDLTDLLMNLTEDERSRFMDVTGTEQKPNFFNFDAVDIAGEIVFQQKYPEEVEDETQQPTSEPIAAATQPEEQAGE